MSIEKTVQQKFLEHQCQLMEEEHKLQEQRDQILMDSFQRATEEILEMSNVLRSNFLLNHNMNHDHLNNK